MSMNKNNSHSWVRISQGLNKLVPDLRTRRTTTTSRKPLRCSSKNLRWKRRYLLLHADQRPKQNHEDALLPAHPQELYPSRKESGLMLSQKIILQSLTQCQNNWTLFEKKMEIIFGRFCAISTLVWWNVEKMAGGGGNKKRSPYCTDSSGQERKSLSPSSSRSFRTQSHWSYTAGQCIDSISSSTFIILDVQSIYTPSWFQDWYREDKFWSKSQSAFFTSVDLMNKEHRDPNKIDLEAPRLVWYKQKVEETSKHGVLGRHQTCSKERIQVLSNTIERNHHLRHTPSLVDPESYYDGNWINHTRESM